MVERGLREAGRRRGEKAILVGVQGTGTGEAGQDSLEELGRLADTAGAVVLDRVVQRREAPDASTYIGRGKAEEIAALAKERGAEVVLFDVSLAPAQIRNLEKILGVRVVDRSELILDIFALHARSHQSQLQVELAQMEYLMPRLRRMWTHLSREGGLGAVGIGARGPGEKQIEIDRRILRRKTLELKRELKEIAARTRRMTETRSPYFNVSLVGYTNAGKSTLLRRLTGAETLVADQLFSTLDTQTRAWQVEGRKKVFLSDTVGFIRDLPHHLVASFYATLEEVRAADLLLHVVDAAHPNAVGQIQAVESVLEEIGALEAPRILVLNKADRVQDPVDLHILSRGREPAVAVSAVTGAGVERLCDEVRRRIHERQSVVEFKIPAGAGRLLAFLAEHGTVLDRTYEDGMVSLRVRIGSADHARANKMAAELDR
ncbi:MAG: GTPase HflX [Planctomycetaceae bacterium]